MSSILKVDTIQDQSGNNIINESGNVITIGASGDTITVPAGASLSGDLTGITNLTMSGDLTVDTNTLFVDASADKVGINTTSPARQLTVSGSTAPVIAIVDTGTSGSPSLFFGDSSADNVGKIQYANSDNSLAFVVNSSERARIDSSGRLLVGKTVTTRTTAGAEIRPDGFIRGTKDASHSLDVVRTTDDGDAIRIYKDNTNVGVIGTQKWGIGIASPSVPLDVNSSTQTTLLKLTSTAGTSSAITFANTGSNDSIAISAESDDLKLRTDDGNILFALAENSEKMRIDSSGLVRVGNTSSTGHGSIYNLIVGNESSGGDAGVLIVTPNNENAYFGFGDSGGVPCSLNYNHNSNFLRTYVNGSEAMRIDSSGHAIIPAGVTLGTSAGTYNASNTLDDYEEGDWTPTAVDGIAGLTKIKATYTKIGRSVTVYAEVNAFTSKDGNQLRIGGLPFNPSLDGQYMQGTTESDGGSVGIARTDSTNARIRFYRSDGSSSASRTNFIGTNLGNGLRFSLTYFT